jgi:septin family protein
LINIQKWSNLTREVNVPKTSFFLFGPRGTGKSTFVKSLIHQGDLYIDFLDPDTFRTYAAFPETLTDYNGLISFGDDYPEASLVLLYRGNVTMKNKNMLVVPVELFLRNPGEYLK